MRAFCGEPPQKKAPLDYKGSLWMVQTLNGCVPKRACGRSKRESQDVALICKNPGFFQKSSQLYKNYTKNWLKVYNSVLSCAQQEENDDLVIDSLKIGGAT